MMALFGYWELVCMVLFAVGVVWAVVNFIRKKRDTRAVILIVGGIVLLIVFAFLSAGLLTAGVISA